MEDVQCKSCQTRFEPAEGATGSVPCPACGLEVFLANRVAPNPFGPAVQVTELKSETAEETVLAEGLRFDAVGPDVGDPASGSVEQPTGSAPSDDSVPSALSPNTSDEDERVLAALETVAATATVRVMGTQAEGVALEKTEPPSPFDKLTSENPFETEPPSPFEGGSADSVSRSVPVTALKVAKVSTPRSSFDDAVVPVGPDVRNPFGGASAEGATPAPEPEPGEGSETERTLAEVPDARRDTSAGLLSPRVSPLDRLSAQAPRSFVDDDPTEKNVFPDQPGSASPATQSVTAAKPRSKPVASHGPRLTSQKRPVRFAPPRARPEKPRLRFQTFPEFDRPQPGNSLLKMASWLVFFASWPALFVAVVFVLWSASTLDLAPFFYAEDELKRPVGVSWTAEGATHLRQAASAARGEGRQVDEFVAIRRLQRLEPRLPDHGDRWSELKGRLGYRGYH